MEIAAYTLDIQALSWRSTVVRTLRRVAGVRAAICASGKTMAKNLRKAPLRASGTLREAFTRWNMDPRKVRAAKAGDRIESRNGLVPGRVDVS